MPTAGFLLISLGRILREDTDAALGSLGLSLRHLSALGHLSRRPGLSYSELARRAGVTPQSMQATLRQLESLGAVERRTDPGRGRTAELHVTPAGSELIGQGKIMVDDAERQLLAGVPPEQRQALVTALTTAFQTALNRSSPKRGI